MRAYSLLLVSLLLGACASTTIPAKRLTSFSSAVTRTTSGVHDGFAAVEAQQRARFYDGVVLSYVERKAPATLNYRPLIDADTLSVRQDVLDGLDAYAQILATVAGNAPFDSLDTESQALGAALKSIDLTKWTSLPQISGSQAGVISAAVQALGAFLIERKLASTLPPIIRAQQPNIREIAQFLIFDIGGTAREPCIADVEQVLNSALPLCAGGLLAMLDKAARDRTAQADLLIEKTLAVQQLDIRDLAAIKAEVSAVEGSLADAAAAREALVQTQSALRSMVIAHESLVDAVDPSKAGTDAAIARLVFHANRIQATYSKVKGD